MSDRNMTWKELKDFLESKGVRDEDEIGYIEIYDPSPTFMTVEKTRGGWVIQ